MLTQLVRDSILRLSIIRILTLLNLLTTLIKLLLSLLILHLRQRIISRRNPLNLHGVHFLFELEISLLNDKSNRHPIDLFIYSYFQKIFLYLLNKTLLFEID